MKEINSVPPTTAAMTKDSLAAAAHPSKVNEERGVGEDAERQTRRVNSCKLLLLGHGGVGKSSLVARLIHNTFSEGAVTTERIAQEVWDIPSPLEREQITLNVWDFGGQEIMHSTHQFFLTKRSVYLVVVDASAKENAGNIHYWLGLIRVFAEDCPVIVVTNKFESPYDRTTTLNETRLRTDYPNIKAFVETSCRAATGIQKLRETIENQVKGMEHVFSRLPPEWEQVKKDLTEAVKERHYLELSDYRALANRNGVNKPELQQTLLELLHDLGIVLYYPNLIDPDDSNHTHILDPHWVIRGVYRLLNNPKLFQVHGVLKLCDLGTYILDADGYNGTGRDFIIRMMKKFQLCFDCSVHGDPGVRIPELLPMDGPPIPWAVEATLAFIYHYDVLPVGVMPRFIALSHAKHAKGAEYWRDGIVLEDEGCRVLVSGDEKHRRVSIHVQAISKKPRANPQRALIRTRQLFEQIYKNFDAQAMVPLKDDPQADPIKYEYLCQLEQKYGLDHRWLPDGASREYSVRELLDGIETPEEREKRREWNERFGRNEMHTSRQKQKEIDPNPPAKPSFVTISIVAVAAIVVLIVTLTIVSRYMSEWALLPITIVAVLLVVLAFSFIAVISGEIKGTAFERLAIAVLEKLPLLRNFLPKQNQSPDD